MFVPNRFSMLFFGAAFLSAPCHAQKPVPQIVDPAYASAQRLVDVGNGRRMNIYCVGSGSPTVVFDAGLGNWSQIWGFVQPAIAKRTRACAYDRAGLGFSDPSDRPNDSANIVDDLHHLLGAAMIDPPYVLVGHSYGGMNVRLYADTFPHDVAGLVLDDGSFEDFVPRMFDLMIAASPKGPSREELLAKRNAREEKGRDEDKKCLDGALEGFKPGSELEKTCVATGQNPRFSAAISDVYPQLQRKPGFLKARMSEEIAFDTTSAAELRAARRTFGDMPMVVLSALKTCEKKSDDYDRCEMANKLHVQTQQELAHLSTRGEQHTIDRTGHDIHLERPDAVIDAIDHVLDQLKLKRVSK